MISDTYIILKWRHLSRCDWFMIGCISSISTLANSPPLPVRKLNMLHHSDNMSCLTELGFFLFMKAEIVKCDHRSMICKIQLPCQYFRTNVPLPFKSLLKDIATAGHVILFNQHIKLFFHVSCYLHINLSIYTSIFKHSFQLLFWSVTKLRLRKIDLDNISSNFTINTSDTDCRIREGRIDMQ